MKQLIQISMFLCVSNFAFSQSILMSNSFSTSLSTFTAANGSSGNWVWSNSCAQSTAIGHSGPGHAMYQGSGCQFGNGGNTVSGDLITPSVALPPLGGTLTFNYFIANECISGSCFYDVLSVQISTNNGVSYTTIINSDASPGGMVNTSTWTAVSYNLSSYGNQSVKFKFNFNSGDGIANAYDGIYVDDVNVLGACSISIQAVSGGNTISPQLCAGSSLTLTTNAISNFSWSNGATTSSIVVSPAANTIYSLTATSPSNCTASSAISVTVSPGIPTLAINASTNSICLGKTVTLTASGANSYSWTGGVINGSTVAPQTTTTYVVSGQNGCGTSTAAVTISVVPLQVMLIANPTLVCAGSPATINIAAAATSFTLNPLNLTSQTGSFVVTPTVNTIYTITASDGTCAGVASISLSAKPIPTVNIVSSSTVSCVGAPITMTASGGISYTWNPGNLTTPAVTVSPAGPTLYSVVASNSVGCTATANQVVLTSPSPTVTASSSSSLVCSGSTVTLTANGASSYSWNTGGTTPVITLTPTQSTVYTVTGTFNTCTGTSTVQVNVFNPALSISGPTAICSGSSASLVASAADSYTWSNGAPFSGINVSPTVTTLYTLTTLTSTGSISCPASASFQLLVNSLPTITAIASKTSVCRGQSYTLTASGALSYSWNTGATTASIVASSTAVANVNYTVSGTDANGCSNATFIVIKVNSCIGVNELQGESQFSLFPNPSKGRFTITSSQSQVFIFTNELGQCVRTVYIQPHESELELQLPAGIYNISNAAGIHLDKLIIIP